MLYCHLRICGASKKASTTIRATAITANKFIVILLFPYEHKVYRNEKDRTDYGSKIYSVLNRPTNHNCTFLSNSSETTRKNTALASFLRFGTLFGL